MSDEIVATDDKYYILIHGYMRQASKSFDLDVPSELFDIVNMFYPKLDKWSKLLSEEGFEFVGDYTLKRVLPKNGLYINAYGVDAVHPSSYVTNNTFKQVIDDKHIFKTWSIKMMVINRKFLLFGVIAESKINAVRDHFCRQGFGFGCCIYGNKSVYPVHWNSKKFRVRTYFHIDVEAGSIVDCILYFKGDNRKHFCMGFRENDDEIVETFHNLDINQIYHFAVAFNSHGQCVEFV